MEEEHQSENPIQPDPSNPTPEQPTVYAGGAAQPGAETPAPRELEEPLPPVTPTSETHQEEKTMAESYPSSPVVDVPPPAKSNKRTIWIIVIVALVLLCCCCLIGVAAYYGMSAGGDFNFDFEYPALLPYLSFI